MSRGRSSFTFKSTTQGASSNLVSDVLKVRRYLLKGLHDAKAAIELQLDGQDMKFQVRVMDADFRKDGLWIELHEPPPGLLEGVAAMFMIYSPDIGVMGFRAKLAIVQENGWLNLGFPEKLVRTQKRLDPRYTIPRAYELFVEFKKPPVETTNGVSFTQIPRDRWQPHTYRIFDVSSTGLGFLIPDSLVSQYPKGMLLKRVKFRIRGREINAEAEVMSCLPHKFGATEPTQKVGIRFTQITQDNQDSLRAYVVENLIQYDTLTDD